MMTQPTVDESVQKYTNYIDDVLKPDLAKLEQRLKKVSDDLSDLIQQRHTLQEITNKVKHPKGYKTQINLGCDFFMEAEVPDTSSMLVNIGLNHYLEFTVPAANIYLDALIDGHERKVKELHTKVAETNAYIKMMLIGVGAVVNKDPRLSI